jgi:hypothetical protein
MPAAPAKPAPAAPADHLGADLPRHTPTPTGARLISAKRREIARLARPSLAAHLRKQAFVDRH